MNRPTIVVVACLALASCASPPDDRQAKVKATVAEFYRNFDEGFNTPADYATGDWYHINPYGGVDKGRDATLETVRDVHRSFLKGTKDTVKDIDIRFASDDVAVATVTSEMTPFTSPDGVRHGVERHLRTFVVVKRDSGWLIMQDHNTTVVPLPPPPGEQPAGAAPPPAERK
ncbi:MAG: SgcJ/EcaC family oxidoreductase [Bryobacteraceae bacterium]